MANPITKVQVTSFLEAWFRALDDHAPVQECYDMLADDGLAMYFPDAVVWNLATFKEWYDGVTNLFFDEKHDDIQIGEPRISGKQAEVDVVIRWQASWWEPGMAQSRRVNLVATQKWRMRRSHKNAYGLEIVYHNAEAKPFKFEPESAPLPLNETKIKEPSDSIIKDMYQQLCTSYHQIDDFRAKLLGFLPLASGAGIFFLNNGSAPFSNSTKEFAGPIGVFGMVVTLGLFAYEIYGIKKCGALIAAGQRMERQLGIAGQFTSRPRGVLRDINEPFAAGVIYPAVLAAWAFLVPLGRQMPTVVSILFSVSIFLAGFVGMFFYNRHLERKAQNSQTRLTEIEAA